MVSADYRPWEIQRLVGRCASCGETKRLEENGLCAGCENKTRDHQASAPAFRPVISAREVARPDDRSRSFGSIAGGLKALEPAISYPRRSRDAW